MTINELEIKELIEDQLPKVSQVSIEKYTSYLKKLDYEKDKKTGVKKNAWVDKKDSEFFANAFARVHAAGLEFDGVHVTLQNRGITLDYVAIKNKMLNVYPETRMAVNLVYEGDTFDFDEANCKITYSHKQADPFNKVDDKIIGAYCIIKNSRGEFITTIDGAEISKHRKKAKTDYIWREWYPDMVKKTVVRKACKFHFDDLVDGIDDIENEYTDLDNPVDVELEVKQKVEACKTTEDLAELQQKVKPTGSAVKLFKNRFEEITNEAA